jgi:hypothetical protein
MDCVNWGNSASNFNCTRAARKAIQFQLHPRSQKGEAFEQPFHVWIAAGEFVQGKPAGNLGEFLGKFAGGAPQVLELLVVVL